MFGWRTTSALWCLLQLRSRRQSTAPTLGQFEQVNLKILSLALCFDSANVGAVPPLRPTGQTIDRQLTCDLLLERPTPAADKRQ
jgi:hypothetical protein